MCVCVCLRVSLVNILALCGNLLWHWWIIWTNSSQQEPRTFKKRCSKLCWNRSQMVLAPKSLWGLQILLDFFLSNMKPLNRSRLYMWANDEYFKTKPSLCMRGQKKIKFKTETTNQSSDFLETIKTTTFHTLFCTCVLVPLIYHLFRF